MAIKDEILDQLMNGYEKPEDLLGEDGLLQELKKALVERTLGEELPAVSHSNLLVGRFGIACGG